MDNMYKSPQSDLLVSNKKKANFSSLNFWRKLYLALSWAGFLLFSIMMVWAGIESPEVSLVFVVGFVIIMFGITYWHHYAIVKRNLTQITALAILNIIPLGNIIGCLIMISIRRVTKKELMEYDFTS